MPRRPVFHIYRLGNGGELLGMPCRHVLSTARGDITSGVFGLRRWFLRQCSGCSVHGLPRGPLRQQHGHNPVHGVCGEHLPARDGSDRIVELPGLRIRELLGEWCPQLLKL